MKKISVALIAILVACTGFAENGKRTSHPWNEVINVSVIGQTEKSATVVIETIGEVDFYIFKVDNPSRLVVEIVNAVCNSSKREVRIGSTLIERIRLAQYKDDPIKTVRVVFDMGVKNYYYVGSSTMSRIRILLGMT
jgi:hypothetical protein